MALKNALRYAGREFRTDTAPLSCPLRNGGRFFNFLLASECFEEALRIARAEMPPRSFFAGGKLGKRVHEHTSNGSMSVCMHN